MDKVNCQTVLPRDDQAPLSFFVEGREDYMIDMKNAQMYLSVRVKKIKTDGTKTDLAEEDKVTIYNGFLYTFWKVTIFNLFKYLLSIVLF